MKINKVKQYVSSNISRFEKDKYGYRSARSFSLYDKNNTYRGEYNFVPIKYNDNGTLKSSMSIIRIMRNKLKQDMQEVVFMSKRFVTLKDNSSDTFTKILPSEITTTTTIMDFHNDKYKTVKTVSKLKNNLQRLRNNDSNIMYSDNSVIYEPLKEEPQYEKSVEYIKEGSISKQNNIIG